MTGASQDAIQALEGQLVAALGIKQEPPVAVEPKEQQPAPTPEPEPAPATEEQPVTEPEVTEPPAEPETPEPADRIRLGKEYTDADKALVNAAHMLVKGGQAKNFTEAFARVSGLSTPATHEPEPVAPQIPPEITQYEQEVAGLEAKLDELGLNEGLFNGEIATLTKQLSRANAKLEGAKIRHESKSEVATAVDDATFEQQRAGVLRATEQEYPGIKDHNSQHYVLTKRLAKAAMDKDDPYNAKLFDLDAPKFFADEAAKILGIKPATAVPSAPQPKPTPSATTTPAKPGPAPGSRQTVTQPALTSQDIAKMADQIIADTLAGKGGPPKTTAPPRAIMLG